MAWQIDTSHSEVTFSARHMMLSKVRGRFEQFEGTIDGNEEHPELSSVAVTIAAASINTRDTNRDNHLKSADFLNAEQYPSITFASRRIEMKGADRARLIGDLTIRDVTREVALDVEYHGQAKSPWGTTSAGFSATTTINRKDWNLTWNVALETGGVLVGEEITINIELEVVQQVAQPAEAVA